jgi:hypothetical protein
MPAEPGNLHEQEHSIKAREHEVFVKPLRAATAKEVKPFVVYLRETPAEPLAVTTKVMLWMMGAIVGLLFLAAIWRVAQRQSPPSRAAEAVPSAKTANSQIEVPILTRESRLGKRLPVWPRLEGLTALRIFRFDIG